MAERMTYAELAAVGVAWYRQHGKYPSQRIRPDRDGVRYVIGDWSWNQRHSGQHERIDDDLTKAHLEPSDA